MELERIAAKNGRWYQGEVGPPVPSVTTILSVWPKGEAFSRWLGNSESYEAAIAYRDEAGEMGTRVHDAVEALLLGGTVTANQVDDPRFAKLVQGFVNWWTENAPELVVAEARLVNYMDEYAGTCDIICLINDELWLIDVKTSKTVYANYHVQTAAYAQAWELDTAQEIERRGILLLKDGTKKGWQLVEAENTQREDYEAFLAAKTIWHYENGYEPELIEPIKPKEIELSLQEV